MSNPETTDLLARLRAHSGPAIMGCTCRSNQENCPACDCGHAADEIERLREALKKIAKRWPCGSAEAMSRLARETLGL